MIMAFMNIVLPDGDQVRLRVRSENVMRPSPLTCLLAENLDVPRKSTVVDLGCGCGVLGILAAKLGAKVVYAVDVNPHALNDTRFNASTNGVSSIVRPLMCEIRTAARLLEGKVDIVLSNPPQTPRKYQRRKSEWLSIAQNGGASGRTILDSIISITPKLYKSKSRTRKLELVTTSLVGIGVTFDNLAKAGFSSSIVARTLIPFTIMKKTGAKRTLVDLSYERAAVIHSNYLI